MLTRRRCSIATALALGLATSLAAYGEAAGSASVATASVPGTQQGAHTATPIKHLVVIFGENVSFDHYFGTYPKALNPAGESAFNALPNTPRVDGLLDGLLRPNPNSTNAANGADAADPFRLDRSQALTASQDHAYKPEQMAFDNGAMDLFPKYTGRTSATGGSGALYTNGLVMGYYDGNTVTALWNYAQHFALNDHSFDTTFGPSTPGALNLISGQTNGVTVTPANANSRNIVGDGAGGLTVIGDLDPTGDVCSKGTTVSMQGKNVGDMLSANNISWGWFEGGFDLSATNVNGSTGCARSSYSPVVESYKADYVPHHQPFQYYASTANPRHKRPASVATIGMSSDGGANHQYDIEDFYAAVSAGNFPAVSFLKAPAYQDAHAGNSDPLDEQAFVTKVINFLQQADDWKDTAVVLAYDDSDGWYDHAHHIVNASASTQDALNGPNSCGRGTPLGGLTGVPVQGRCGYGPRLPLLVVSPYAKTNYVDHTLTDQTSILRFIEDNWLNGSRIGQGSFDVMAGPIDNMFDFASPRNPKLFLDTVTGQPQR
ncbi:phospholipase C [Paraburkholderia elongata]|uniref:Phospholipase n=1 Tax=Paraburkholderia elongata TaxID=2675747 RepID=A0A972SL19_9BURK|nr:alkaline phosphatase family protein [Paraburkholderia elongata]NPT57340.1 phospholipase [Paraburkholderia elongata]